MSPKPAVRARLLRRVLGALVLLGAVPAVLAVAGQPEEQPQVSRAPADRPAPEAAVPKPATKPPVNSAAIPVACTGQ